MQKSLYLKTFAEAVTAGEIETWRESHKINLQCKKYLEENANQAYADGTVDEYISKAAAEYGLERCLYVVGKTIQTAPPYDVRISRESRKCAAIFQYDDSHSRDYIIERIHHTQINDIYEKLIDIEKESTLKFLYNGFKVKGELFKASYSLGPFTGQAQGTIGVYTSDYREHPDVTGFKKYHSGEMEFDDFETEKYYVLPDNPHYSAVCEAYNKQERHREKVWRNYTPRLIDAEYQIKKYALGLTDEDMGQNVPQNPEACKEETQIVEEAEL